MRYNFSSQADLSLIRLKSVNYGSNTLRYFGQKKWNVEPGDTEFSRTLPKIHKENTGNLEFVLEHSNEKVKKYGANNEFFTYISIFLSKFIVHFYCFFLFEILLLFHCNDFMKLCVYVLYLQIWLNSISLYHEIKH